MGKLAKELAVSGRREFTGILSSSIVEREPLAAMPITYENAFGGPKHAGNPVGRGHKTNELPSIEYFDQRMRLPGDNITPAGFGALATHWEPRKSMVGTFGSDYLEKYWPGYPANFDAGYFNAAPSDQQVAGHLRGDEEIVLENLHKAHPNLQTRLPGWRVVCLRENEDGRCELIPLVIDTLWINPDANQLVLVWRGRISVQTPDALEIKRLGFLVETLASQMGEASQYQKRLQELIDQRDQEFEPEPEPPAQTAEPTVQSGDSSEFDAAEMEAMQAAVALVRARAGRSADEELSPAAGDPPPLSPEAQAKFDEIMATLEQDERRQAEEDAARKWNREKVIAAVEQKQSLSDADLSGLDLRDCNFAAADFRGAKLDGVDFSRSVLTRALLTGCSMPRAVFHSSRLDEADLAGVNLQEGLLVKSNLTSAKLDDADLTDAVVDGADLLGATAQHAIFQRASLAAAKLSKSNLIGAVLSGAKGPQADFKGAILKGAACDHADWCGASFEKADLTEADFTASKLEKANLNGALAVDANFTEAVLNQAALRGANCEGMWLSSAHADGADFQGASCVDLQCDGTSAKQANFSGCRVSSFRGGKRANLTGAIFRNAQGTDPVFESCLLDGADFSHTRFPGANFIHASAAKSNFTAAELTGARFDHANCQDAVFVTANLFQAIFASVNLNGADISDGNFYGVEFLDARISKLRVKNCNLQMTKLEQWATTKNR